MMETGSMATGLVSVVDLHWNMISRTAWPDTPQASILMLEQDAPCEHNGSNSCVRLLLL